MLNLGNAVYVRNAGLTSRPHWKRAILTERVDRPNGQKGYMVVITDHSGEWFVGDNDIVLRYESIASRWHRNALLGHNREHPCLCLRCRTLRWMSPFLVGVNTRWQTWRSLHHVKFR